MVIIAHYGIDSNINRKGISKFLQAVFYPLSAMFEAFT